MSKKIVLGLAAAAAALSVSSAANAAIFFDYAGTVEAVTSINSFAETVSISTTKGTVSDLPTTDYASDLAKALNGLKLDAGTAIGACTFTASCVVDVQYVNKGAIANDFLVLTNKGGNLVATETMKLNLLGFSDALLGQELFANVQLSNQGINNTAAVPEPTTWAMMLIGFGMMGLALRKRSKLNARTVVA